MAADRGGDFQASPPETERPEKVAIIGSGPAGLAAAYFLRREGFRVTIFEAFDRLGGMLRVGIPDYRLPPAVLDRDIARILTMGVETRTGVRFGRDTTLDSLNSEDFSAVFLGIGAHAGLRLGIDGEDAIGVEDAVGFLRRANLGDRSGPGQKVSVIGGGNVAVDAARTARRLGSGVTILYRRTRDEMPAYMEEIDDALEEGILLEELTSPVRIVSENGRVEAVECIRNELGPPDKSGRRRPVPVQGSEFTIACDGVIPAIGQKADAGVSEFLPGLKWTARGWIEAHRDTLQTSIPHVFAAGDAVSGPATVIEAVAQGRKAANAMAAFLDGRLEELVSEAEQPPDNESEKNWAPIPPAVMPVERARPVLMDPAARIQGFSEAALGLPEDMFQREADRCLNCGVCSECMECVAACERGAIDHTQQTVRNQIRVGAIILATGFDLFDPSAMKQFGYGRFPNVLTSLEFERLNNATGPTGGTILMRDQNGGFTRPPESVAIVHCVGSRDVNYHEYCSRVCCMYALKYGHLVHDKIGPQARIFDFYIDLRCFGKGYEEFYRRCQEEGIRFIRGKPSQIESENGQLIVVGEDTLMGEKYRVPVDMAILCAAMQARSDAADVGRVFGVNQGRDGFFLEEHPKLAPLSTATDGIFLAGTCQAPKDVPDTVSQASGAAVKALSLVTRGTVEIEPTTSRIDPDVCAGCRTCIGLCPYGAIEFDPRRNVSVVNDALCKGCGSCSGFCPSGAARVRHFDDRQIFSEIDGLFDGIHAVGGQ